MKIHRFGFLFHFVRTRESTLCQHGMQITNTVSTDAPCGADSVTGHRHSRASAGGPMDASSRCSSRRAPSSPSPHCDARAPRAARRSRPHARRLPKGRKPTAPGEIIQLDTLSLTLDSGRPYIRTAMLDRKLAQDAQDIVWDHSVRPKDAVHVATAIGTKAGVLNTFDRPLINKSGQIGSPRFTIAEPFVTAPRLRLAGRDPQTPA